LPIGTIAIAIGPDDDPVIAGRLAARTVITPCMDPLDIGIPLGDDIPAIDPPEVLIADEAAGAGDDDPCTTYTRTSTTAIAAAINAPATATARSDQRGFPPDGCTAAAPFGLLDITTPSFAN
jgi:hypothetical protein